MVNQFTTTGSTTHATTVSGLHNGQTYNYYVRCQDSVGNANPNDYLITFHGETYRIRMAGTAERDQDYTPVYLIINGAPMEFLMKETPR